MPHPLVVQLYFTRSEWQRALDGLTDADARRRLEPMNCISWMIGHLTWQEQLYWLKRARGQILVPELDDLVGYGRPASTPSLAEMWQTWYEITHAADLYLDMLTTENLQSRMLVEGQPFRYNIGTMLQRVIYHYWFHIGEALAVRQMLGHGDLPEFVGDIQTQAPYRAE